MGTEIQLQTFPKSTVEIIETTRLFSVNTLQYLLFTAMGLTCAKLNGIRKKIANDN